MIDKRQIFLLIGGATILGAGAGMATTPSGRSTIIDGGKALFTAADMRRRPPQPGDSWGGCNDARAAGTAPIYRWEPGYRANMDGDGDGVACESY